VGLVVEGSALWGLEGSALWGLEGSALWGLERLVVALCRCSQNAINP